MLVQIYGEINFQTPRVWGRDERRATADIRRVSDPTRVGKSLDDNRGNLSLVVSDPTRVGKSRAREGTPDSDRFQTPRVWGRDYI